MTKLPHVASMLFLFSLAVWPYTLIMGLYALLPAWLARLDHPHSLPEVVASLLPGHGHGQGHLPI